MTIDSTTVEIRLVGGRAETEFGNEDLIDQTGPENTSFGVALESFEDRNDMGPRIDGHVEALLEPGAIGVVNGKVAVACWRRRLLVGIGGVSDGDDVVAGGGESKEETHTGLLDAAGIGLGGVLVKPGCSAFRAINAGTAFATTIIFDKIGPLDTEDIGRGAVGFRRGSRHRKAEGAGGKVGIELGVEGIIPLVPVGEPLKTLAGEAGQGTFLFSHVGGLESIDVRDGGRRWGRSIGCKETLDMLQLVETKVKRSVGIGVVGFALRGKGDGDGGGRR